MITTSYAFSNLTPEFGVNTTTGGDQTAAALTQLQNGEIAYFYQDDEPVLPNQNVLGRFMTQAGGPGGAAQFTVQAGMGDEEVAPQTATLSNGNVVVAYQDSNAVGAAGGTTTVFRFYNPAGVELVPLVSNYMEDEFDNQTAPVIAALTGGGFVIAHIDQSVGADNNNTLNVQRFTNGGALVGTRIQVSQATNGDPLRQPAIAGLANGGFVVVWSEDIAAGVGTVNYDIFAQRYNSDGTLNGGRITIDNEADNQTRPTVAARPDGGFVVAWDDEQNGSAFAGNIDFVSVSAAGVFGFKGEIIGLDAQHDASIAVLTNDIFTITYTTNENGTSDIRAQAFQGTSNLASYDLETVDGVQSQSAAINLGRGEFITAWTDFHVSADGDGSGIESQRDRLVRTTTSDGLGEEMLGDELADIMFGNGGNDFLYGGNANDQLYGQGENDYLSGGAGDDYLSGGSGNDTLFGGAGTDTLVGGSGDDQYYIQNSEDTGDIINDSGGNDRVFASVSYALAAAAPIETLGTDNNAGNHPINLNGSNSANIVIGNNGVNRLDGALGSDTLYGLGGTDYFTFSTALGAANVDVIADFTSVDDVIFLDDAIFTGIAGGFLGAGAFRSAAGAVAATNAAERIIHNSSTGDLYWDDGGNGGPAPVLFANIGAGTALANFDFFVY